MSEDKAGKKTQGSFYSRLPSSAKSKSSWHGAMLRIGHSAATPDRSPVRIFFFFFQKSNNELVKMFLDVILAAHIILSCQHFWLSA